VTVDLPGAAYAASPISSTLKGGTKQFGRLQAPAIKSINGLRAYEQSYFLPQGQNPGGFGGLFHFASLSAGRSTICTTLLFAVRFDSIMASPETFMVAAI
jgi:hypothetical protein